MTMTTTSHGTQIEEPDLLAVPTKSQSPFPDYSQDHVFSTLAAPG